MVTRMTRMNDSPATASGGNECFGLDLDLVVADQILDLDQGIRWQHVTKNAAVSTRCFFLA